jgi:hypothetical protein
MTLRFPILLACALLLLASAGTRGADALSPTIDPDKSVYGVPFGASENQLIAKLGAPSGTIQLSASRRALIYGKGHAFIIRKGVFRSVMISDHMLDYRLISGMEPHAQVDAGSGPWHKKGNELRAGGQGIGTPRVQRRLQPVI